MFEAVGSKDKSNELIRAITIWRTPDFATARPIIAIG
jgi:hypothetical protein